MSLCPAREIVRSKTRLAAASRKACVRSAGTILAINPDRDVPVFAAADVGITADWRTAVPALVAVLRSRL